MSEHSTVVVQEIAQKSGEKNGKPWTQHKLKDANGSIYSCFDGSILAPVKDMTGQKVDIEWEQNGQFKNLLSAQPHSNGSTVPETYSHQKPDGEADWDKVAIGKTRCALWAAYLSGHVAAGIYSKASSAEGVDPRDAVLRAGIMFVVAAEKDVFERAPGDDGVPF